MRKDAFIPGSLGRIHNTNPTPWQCKTSQEISYCIGWGKLKCLPKFRDWFYMKLDFAVLEAFREVPNLASSLLASSGRDFSHLARCAGFFRQTSTLIFPAPPFRPGSSPGQFAAAGADLLEQGKDLALYLQNQ
jgi:hypothetical protein